MKLSENDLKEIAKLINKNIMTKFKGSGRFITPEQNREIYQDFPVSFYKQFNKHNELCENCNQPQGNHYSNGCPKKEESEIWITEEMLPNLKYQ